MNRRNAISRMLGAPLALAVGPVVMAGEPEIPVRPRRSKPLIDSNPYEPDFDRCPCDCGSEPIKVEVFTLDQGEWRERCWFPEARD